MSLTPTNQKRRRQMVSSTPLHEHHGLQNPVFSYSDKENAFMRDSYLEVKSLSAITNPYEVIRPPSKKAKIEAACYENPAIDLSSPKEKLPAPVFVQEAVGAGIANPALDTAIAPVDDRAIAIPFSPSIHKKINFENVQLESIGATGGGFTKLLFCGEDKVTVEKDRKSLSMINEETIDISRELDCYQLELENSMNEAKASGGSAVNCTIVKKERKLEVLVEEKETEIEEKVTTTNVEVQIQTEPKKDQTNDSFEDDEALFKNPAPFQRAYRRPPVAPSIDAKRTDEGTQTEAKKADSIAGSFRRSIRRLLHVKEKEKEKSDEPGFISAIRHSLRRKKVEKVQPMANMDISIIPEGNRAVFNAPVGNFSGKVDSKHLRFSLRKKKNVTLNPSLNSST